MDKQEYREFLDEIKKGYNAKNYEQVAAYADEMDFGKIKDPRILEMISDSYDHLGETDNAIDALAAAFARNKSSKQTAYKLSELCIKAGDLDDAVDYYESYRKLANNNSKALLLKYEIGKAGGVPAKELIKVLEAYNAKEKDEKWEYELARLYHETGQAQKCVETCDNIFLWYAGGEYVKKALELKFSHTPLSEDQQIRYEEMMEEFLDPSERTRRSVPEVDEVAEQLANEYLGGAEDYEKQMAKAEERKTAPVFTADQELTETARLDALHDTRVIPISEIMSELDSDGEEAPEETEQEAEAAEVEEAEEAPEETADEQAVVEEAAEEKPEDVSPEELLKTSGTITFEQLRAMIKDGNRKQAQSGLFFTYKEPTEEEIAEEAAQKAARAEARRKAEEEAARKAAEEKAAREAAAAAAREAARLEEEARVEAALRIEEEARKLAAVTARPDDSAKAPTQRIDPDMEIDETRFINRNEVLARLDEADKKIEEAASEGEQEISAKESLGFTGLINAIAAEVDLEEVTAAPPVEETKEDDEVGATQIFTRAEIDTVLGSEDQTEYKTPEQKLGAAIEQIMDDANATVERDMEETKSIRIVLPVAAANKLGVASAKLSQYASSVIKPDLEAQADRYEYSSEGRPRIIDNVDFSYIQVSSDEDGQLGLNLEYLALKDEFDVEGQLTIDDIMKSYSRKLKLNQAKVLDIESERLRKIQEAVNLTSPVKLPYSMDDLMFDDIEMSDIDGNAEVVEGDIFQFDPESIGVIPSDEELLAQIEEKEAAEAAAEAAQEESAAEEEPVAEEAEEVSETEETAEPEDIVIPAVVAAGIEEAQAEEELIPSEDDILEALEAENEAEAEELAAEEETVFEEEIPAEEEISAEEEIPAEEELIAEEEEILAGEEPLIEEEAAAEEEMTAEEEPEAAETAELSAEAKAAGEEYLPTEESILAALAAIEAEKAAENAVITEEDVLPSEDDILAALEAETAEPEAEAQTYADEAERAFAELEAIVDGTDEEVPEAEIEEEIAAEELSDAEKAIAAFEMKAASEDLGEAEKAIDDELFDVMAELSQAEEAPQEQPGTEELLEADAFEEMFGALMSDEAVSDEEDVLPSEDDILSALEAEKNESGAERFADQTGVIDIPAEVKAEVKAEEEAPEEEVSEEEVPEEAPVVVSATGYRLSDESRARLSEFLLIDGMEQNIVNVISDIIEKKRAGRENAGNLIVTGDIKSGKTFLAIEMIKAVTEEFGSKNGKVAKVQADLLNGKNIEKVFEKIGGSDLIIENVGYLDDETIENLTEVISSGRYGSMVIIEGNQLAVESIFNSFPAFGALFENRIDISELSIVQWAEIAMQYADEKGFVLDDMAKLALHARINEINVPTARLGYDEVLDIMDDAIAKAEKRSSGRLFAAFKKGESDKREIIESDFM